MPSYPTSYQPYALRGQKYADTWLLNIQTINVTHFYGNSLKETQHGSFLSFQGHT